MKLFLLLQLNNITWINVVVALLIFFSLWFIIAKIETLNKVKDLFHRRTESLIGWSIGIFILCAILLSFLNRILSEEIWPIVILIKIILAFIVSRQASISGRNKILWFFLGLFEHFTALIVLGLTPKYIINSFLSKDKLKEINQDIQTQLNKIKNLENSGLLTSQEYEKKLQLLKGHYYENLSNAELNKVVPNTTELLSQLEEAYKDGLLTEEEYQFKLQNLTNN